MTFHLHIKGRVQGVGFRPHVYRWAIKKNIFGYVSNDADGVHVIFNHSSHQEADLFAKEIIQEAPSKSIIQSRYLKEIAQQHFYKFSILVKESNTQPGLLISPDFSMCEHCRKEFHDSTNRRFQYPFITCTLCGPRYSIMKQLPYERYLTTMYKFNQCPECQKEYDEVTNRRYFSQTNCCATCGIQVTWHSKYDSDVLNEPKLILIKLLQAFREGKIVAVKGIGGFLLMCDATNRKAIQTLRERKQRPKKPLAVLFPDVEMVKEYTHVNSSAIKALSGEASPIVLLYAKEKCFDELNMEGIAPGLSSIGAMLPYAPLLECIASAFKNPLIATSGNISGSCIVFQSSKKEELLQYADFILDHNRDIVVPQDDSVVRFTEKDDIQIIIRRSRGLAPSIIVPLQLKKSETIFATGAMLKSAFALQHNNQIYLSQFLGSLESYDTQQNYRHTFNHFMQFLKVQPQVVLADLHPDYPSTQFGCEYSKEWNTPLKKIQHHEAHFAAILGEHDLFKCEEKILGVIWDGTGLGSDGHIWGSEFFLYEKGNMKRVHYLEPFTNIAGDKMAKESRLAALAISENIKEALPILHSRFSKQEWQYYQQEIAQQRLQNSSAGRYFDGVAALLDLININTYEGEAALRLEQQAAKYFNKNNFESSDHYFHDEIDQAVIPMKHVISNIIKDIARGKAKEEIAALFHISLVAIIGKTAQKLGIKKLAFSGGVFQNAVLIDLIKFKIEKLVHLDTELEFYFHRQLPPNDESIAFGQLMHYQNIKT